MAARSTVGSDGEQQCQPLLSLEPRKGPTTDQPTDRWQAHQALELDEGWIDKFLDGEVSQGAEETPVDLETERLLQLKAVDDHTPDASEDLLILLANTHARGQYTDTFTAYQALSSALEAAERIRQRGEMRGNANEQLDLVMREVAALNAAGRLDDADKLLDAEEQRITSAHRAERERQDAVAAALLERRLDQDRLRNDPQAAAKRLIRDLHRQAPPGGVWHATNGLLDQWGKRGQEQGDVFDLRVALALAKTNYDKAKRPSKGYALLRLGAWHLHIGALASDDRNLKAAEAAACGRLRQISKKRNPQDWAAAKANVGATLAHLGERAEDDSLLREAVTTFEDVLTVWTKNDAPKEWAETQVGMGGVLTSLGQRARDEGLLRAAITACEEVLSVVAKDAASNTWAEGKNNLGCALLHLGEIAEDDTLMCDAVTAFKDTLTVWTKEGAPSRWASSKNNIGIAFRANGLVTRLRFWLYGNRQGYANSLYFNAQSAPPQPELPH